MEVGVRVGVGEVRVGRRHEGHVVRGLLSLLVLLQLLLQVLVLLDGGLGGRFVSGSVVVRGWLGVASPDVRRADGHISVDRGHVLLFLPQGCHRGLLLLLLRWRRCDVHGP